MDGNQVFSARRGEIKNRFPSPGIEPQFIGRPANGLVTVITEYDISASLSAKIRLGKFFAFFMLMRNKKRKHIRLLNLKLSRRLHLENNCALLAMY
jgi:hypothetical protein